MATAHTSCDMLMGRRMIHAHVPETDFPMCLLQSDTEVTRLSKTVYYFVSDVNQGLYSRLTTQGTQMSGTPPSYPGQI